MDYFPPKTFLTLGPPRNNKFRLGRFEIEPVNDNFNLESYFLSTSLEDSGRFTACIWRHKTASTPKFIHESYEHKTEEQAVRWLEKTCRNLARKKVKRRIRELKKEVTNCLIYLNNLKNGKVKV